MTLIIELTPEQEARLKAEADEEGLKLEDFALLRLVGDKKRSPTARELLNLPKEARQRYLLAAAEAAAPLYEADLALPPEQRELTAFSALEGEPFRE